MKLKILEGNENYTCIVIKLPVKKSVKGLDNLVEVNYLGNSVLTSKNSKEDIPYLFFPVGSVIDSSLLSNNNLFRESSLNIDKTKTGFFDKNCRVKAIKFKGITSTGFILPLMDEYNKLKIGDEFNEIDDIVLCKKYVPFSKEKIKGSNLNGSNKKGISIDKKYAPEHISTSHLMKNLHILHPKDIVYITIKLHGTSARTFNTLIKRKLNFIEKTLMKLSIKIKEEEYKHVVGSRRVIKSIDFNKNKKTNHYYKEDLWTAVSKEYFKDKLYEGECIYYEIIGKTYTGEDIQNGYSYGFNKPVPYIYRITRMNPQGEEVDLTYEQMLERAFELCPLGSHLSRKSRSLLCLEMSKPSRLFRSLADMVDLTPD